MYWPTLKLTKEEAVWITKYYDPSKGRRGVLRRMYPGDLSLNSTERQPNFNLQIGRRSRVFGFTFAGDIDRFRIQIITATGEKHTAVPTRIPHLTTGYNMSPQGVYGVGATPSMALPSLFPYIADPNIVLEPNETLSINGFQTEDRVATDYRIDFVVHVWEFPGMPGSPL